MKLIFIYGMPGSGKLTIARALQQQLRDYKIFHNQMTVDIVSEFFDFATPTWTRLNAEMRKMIFKACAQEGINLITTQVYAHDYPGEDEYIRSIIQLIEDLGGEVHFIHLICADEIIFQRIQNEDRKKHKKVSKPERLKESMTKWDMKTEIHFVENLELDTSILSPQDSATRITKYYSLK
ncbi:MAG: AAA family ATPase [Candidatus Heimdallarchaeota archaeon]|nr:AAA family ATPase [Candidatus Heimdallarchaeota archaeon]